MATELLSLTARSLATKFDNLQQAASSSAGPSSSPVAQPDSAAIHEELHLLEAMSPSLGA